MLKSVEALIVPCCRPFLIVKIFELTSFASRKNFLFVIMLYKIFIRFLGISFWIILNKSPFSHTKLKAFSKSIKQVPVYSLLFKPQWMSDVTRCIACVVLCANLKPNWQFRIIFLISQCLTSCPLIIISKILLQFGYRLIGL